MYVLALLTGITNNQSTVYWKTCGEQGKKTTTAAAFDLKKSLMVFNFNSFILKISKHFSNEDR